MKDYIDRQAAIEAIEKLILPQTKGETAAEEINRVAWRCAINCAEEVIGHIPSAEVEPVRGRWMEMGTNADGTHNVKCSNCGAGYRIRGHAKSFWTKERYKFCPCCDAYMGGVWDD